MPKRKILEGAEVSDRAKQRQELGRLSDLTVQPATRKRYRKATDAFFSFLRTERLGIPTRRDQFDLLLCDYLEHLWSTGIGRGQANDTVAGLQDLQPNLRHHLPGAWRLLKTWAINEVPNRAPPLPEQVVHAMAGWGFFHGHNSFAVSLLIGFYTMLRSGELLGLRSSHVLCAPKDRQVLISLGLTKGGKRQGAAESVILGIESGVAVTQHWKRLTSANTPLARSPATWRSLFSQSLSALGLEKFQFRPYSEGVEQPFGFRNTKIWIVSCCRGVGWPTEQHGYIYQWRPCYAGQNSDWFPECQTSFLFEYLPQHRDKATVLHTWASSSSWKCWGTWKE